MASVDPLSPPPRSPPPRPPWSRRMSGELKARIISAVCLAPPVLWAMWTGGFALTVLLTAAVAVAAAEWGAMHAAAAGRRRAVVVSAVVAAALFLSAVASSPWWSAAALPLAFVTAATAAPERRRQAALGLPYVVVGCVALSASAAGPQGTAALFFVVLSVWATDIGAYAAGRGIGGPKLAPRLSPKKTWAGLLGGMAASAAVCVGLTAVVGAGSAVEAAFLGAALAVAAQSGDLFESWAKRRTGVKDSSRLIPGHGGLLDRIDGLLTAAPAFALYQAAVGPFFA